MNHVLLVTHLFLGLCLVLAPLAAFAHRYQGRRFLLYLLTVQILLGGYAMRLGYKPSLAHVLPALLAWGLYMAANAVARRRPESGLDQKLAGTAWLLIAAAFCVGAVTAKQMGIFGL